MFHKEVSTQNAVFFQLPYSDNRVIEEKYNHQEQNKLKKTSFFKKKCTLCHMHFPVLRHSECYR